MKLSLTLSALLVGGSLFLSGCGDSSSDVEEAAQEVVDNIDGNVTDAINELTAPKFTTEMLGGKTFYSYGYGLSDGKLETDNRFKAIISANATNTEVWASDGSEKYGEAATSIITDTKNRSAIKWQIAGMSDIEFALLKVFDDGSFMTQPTDPDHFDPYPQLFSVSQTADKGQTLYDEFMAEQILTKETLTSKSWYTIDYSENNKIICQGVLTYKEDNSIDAIGVNEDTGELQTYIDVGTYAVNGNVLSMNIPEEGADNTIIYSSADKFIINGSTFFTSKEDAKAFVDMMNRDIVEYCDIILK